MILPVPTAYLCGRVPEIRTLLTEAARAHTDVVRKNVKSVCLFVWPCEVTHICVSIVVRTITDIMHHLTIMSLNVPNPSLTPIRTYQCLFPKRWLSLYGVLFHCDQLDRFRRTSQLCLLHCLYSMQGSGFSRGSSYIQSQFTLDCTKWDKHASALCFTILKISHISWSCISQTPVHEYQQKWSDMTVMLKSLLVYIRPITYLQTHFTSFRYYCTIKSYVFCSNGKQAR